MVKKQIPVLVLGLALIGLLSGAAFASNTHDATVSCAVSAINEIDLSGNPAAMVVEAAVAGSAPTEVTDNSTTYSITSNGTSKKITAVLDADMPTGMTLKINLASAGATSAGDKILSLTTSQNVVTGITKLNEAAQAITYKLSATAAAGVVSAANHTVTLTIADGA
jgi:hypothetical protein